MVLWGRPKSDSICGVASAWVRQAACTARVLGGREHQGSPRRWEAGRITRFSYQHANQLLLIEQVRGLRGWMRSMRMRECCGGVCGCL